MTKRERAAAFTDLLSTFNYIVYDPEDMSAGRVEQNPWMQTHPDLLGEFFTFMIAFRTEVEQRYEEQG